METPPESYSIADEINWTAAWIDVWLRVELPFWLMVDNLTVPIEFNGHVFSVAVHNETHELHGKAVTDSKASVGYQGPLKTFDELGEWFQKIRQEHPDLTFLWRKCKTVLKIASRCNEDVWNRSHSNDSAARPAVTRALGLYLQTLCRSHIH